MIGKGFSGVPQGHLGGLLNLNAMFGSFNCKIKLFGNHHLWVLVDHCNFD